MKAVYFDRLGPPEVLTLGDMPDPVAASGEVVIDIHAASVNAADWRGRSGTFGTIDTFPHIPGRDFSGIVSALGDGVNDRNIGDAVFGVCPSGQEGTYAEKIAVKADIIAPKPKSLSHVEAAAVALTGLTALVSLEDTLKLKSGEVILIQGGAGGVAGFAIQLAKHLGAYVISTASGENLDYLRDLGADEVIDYKTQDFTALSPPCDAVFDTVGGDVALRSFKVLKPGGRAAFIHEREAPQPPRSDVTALRPAVGRDRAHLTRIADLVSSGAIKPPQITEFALSDAATAHRISEARHLRGKLVLRIR